MNPAQPSRPRFDVAADTYDRHAAVQLAAGRDLLAMAEGLSPGRILEAGCGSGLFTAMLCDRWPSAGVEAIDASARMVALAKARLAGRAQVRVADISRIGGDSRCDLVASNCALHWLIPLPPAILRLVDLLRPDGHFLASLMLDGTLGELHALRSALVPDVPVAARMPDFGAVVTAFEVAGCAVAAAREVAYERFAPDARSLLRLLHEQGLTGGSFGTGRRLLNRGELTRLIQEYDRRFMTPQGVRATYRVGFILARKAIP